LFPFSLKDEEKSQPINFGNGLAGRYVTDYLSEGNFLYREPSETFVLLQYRRGVPIAGIHLDMFELGHLVELITYSLEMSDDEESATAWSLNNAGSFGFFDVTFQNHFCKITQNSSSICLNVEQCKTFISEMNK